VYSVFDEEWWKVWVHRYADSLMVWYKIYYEDCL
jgi:hypothetical protein